MAKSILTRRSFQVRIGDSYSAPHSVPNDISQGSVLNPVLFLIYVDDFSDSFLSSIKSFADDFKIKHSLHDAACDFHILQRDLVALTKWSKLWQLNASHEKCYVVHINFRHECFLRLRGDVLSAIPFGILQSSVVSLFDF